MAGGERGVGVMTAGGKFSTKVNVFCLRGLVVRKILRNFAVGSPSLYMEVNRMLERPYKSIEESHIIAGIRQY